MENNNFLYTLTSIKCFICVFAMQYPTLLSKDPTNLPVKLDRTSQ